tara:strand:+ start:1248 stop:1355 length:108 start_codon:yes stop_codon:yes gene_type:complete
MGSGGPGSAASGRAMGMRGEDLGAKKPVGGDTDVK